jgi:hypothetical protein
LYLSGNPFNFQGIKVLRNLIASNKKSGNFLTLGDKEFSKILNKLDFLTKSIFSEDLWNCWKRRALLPNDATSSVFQIMGGLIGSEKLLFLTNVISKGKEDNQEDIYEFILSKMLYDDTFLVKIKALYNDFFVFCKKENCSNIAYKQKLGSSLMDPPDIFIIKFKEFCLIRKEIKKHVMPFAYNKSTKEMIKTFLSNNYISKFLYIKDKEKNFLWKIGSLFISRLLVVIKKEFKELYLFKKMFIHIVNLCTTLEQPIYISFFNVFDSVSTATKKNSSERLTEISKIGFLQNYLKNEIIRIRTNTKKYEKDGKYVNIKMTTNFTRVKGLESGKYELDKLKNELALLPNVCQHLDALILHGVIHFFKRKDLSVLPIHDSFYTQKDNYAFVRTSYFLSYLTFIHENSLKNMLYNLLDFLSRSNLFISFLFSKIIWNKESELTISKNEVFKKELEGWIEKNHLNKKILELIETIFLLHNSFFNSHVLRKQPIHTISFDYCKNILKTE